MSIPPKRDFLEQKIHIPTTISKESSTTVPSSCTDDDRLTVKTDNGIEFRMNVGHNMESVEEQKRLRRVLSNRVSARKYRMKKLQHVAHLEKMVKDLENEIMVLKPRIENDMEVYKMLKMENSVLEERLSLYEENDKKSLEMMREKQAEVNRLKEVYCEEQKMVMQLANPLGHSSYEDRPQTMEENVEIDPALNFNSLTIDPPKSFM